MEDEVDRRIGARSFARLLGDWRPPGRARVDRGARRPGAPARARRRLPLQMRMPAERELAAALGVSRTTVAAAYEALRRPGIAAQPARRGQLDAAAARDAGRGGHAVLPHGTAPGIDLAHAALAAPVDRLRAAAAAAGRRGPRRAPLRARLRPARPPGAARRDRRPVHRAGPAHPPGPGAGHRRGAGRVRARARHAHHARATGCSSSTRPTPTRSTPCAPAARGRCRCRWASAPPDRRVGPGPASPPGARRRAAAGLRHPRLPEPDRRRCSTARDANGWSRWPAARARPLLIDETLAELTLDGSSRRRSPRSAARTRPTC